MQEYFRDFLTIYKSPFHKLVFDKVKLIRIDKPSFGSPYYHFIGRFRFSCNATILNNPQVLENKQSIVKGLHNVDDDFSVEFRKKFTRKVKNKGKLNKWCFNYVFDFHPKNIVDFDIDVENNKLILEVSGYGLFS